MRSIRLLVLSAASAAMLLVSSPSVGASPSASPSAVRSAVATPAETWVDAWAASFLSTMVNGSVQSAPSFNNQTYRLNVYSKLGGTKVRIRVSNKFATNALTVGAAHIALR